MDPTETLALLLIALQEKDAHTATQHLTALFQWLASEGFCPDVDVALQIYLKRYEQTT